MTVTVSSILKESVMNEKSVRVLLLHSVSAKDGESDPDFRIAPIGLFFIAGALKKHGFDATIMPVRLPLFASSGYKEDLKNEIQRIRPDLIGYSFRNLYNFETVKPSSLIDFFSVSSDLPVIQFLRGCSEALIIGGGSGFSLAPELYMETLGLDYGIQGEGETSMVMLVDALRQGKKTDVIPGLVFKKGSALIKNARDSYAGAPSYEMDLSVLSAYKDFYYSHGGYGAIQTRRGCAFRCSYCLYPYLEGGSYRLQPVETIIREIRRYLYDFEMEHIYFVDSVFSSPSRHCLAIVDAIIQNRLKIHWHAYVNPLGLTVELVRKFKQSGCAGLVLTLESGSDEILRYLNKGFSIADSQRAVENLRDAGLAFEVSMMLGTPEETEKTLDETLSFCRNHLQHIPVTFAPGVWMHPVSPIFFDHFHTRNQDVDALSQVILSNDFKRHNDLHYFFSSHLKKRQLIESFFNAVDAEPFWFITGKDIVPDPRAGIMRFTKKVQVRRYCRPWFAGIQAA